MNAQRRILIVDDHVELAENLAEILELRGHECQIAGDAEQALIALEQGSFQSIITDLRLPGLSGLELLCHLRSRSNAIPLILISAFASDAVAAQAHAAGALGVLDKPVDLDRLFQLVTDEAASA